MPKRKDTYEPVFDVPGNITEQGNMWSQDIWADMGTAFQEYIVDRKPLLKDNDIIIATFPRSGTHLVWHMTRWLVQGCTDAVPDTREESHFPSCFFKDSQKHLHKRVLNTHSLPCEIHHDAILNGKHKTIYVYRNPKDTCVSLYHLYTDLDIFRKAGDFTVFADNFCTSLEQGVGGNWIKNILAWEEFTTHYPEAVLVLRYEDIVAKPLAAIRKIVDFCEMAVSEELIQQVAAKSHFDTMKTLNNDGTTRLKTRFPEGNPTFFRKGKIGGWKNRFTVALNERFDEKIAKGTSCLERFYFTYE